jgi:phosphoribosylformylglycinamidine synthase
MTLSLQKAQSAWEATAGKSFSDPDSKIDLRLPRSYPHSARATKSTLTQPNRGFDSCLSGTNCEYDTKKVMIWPCPGRCFVIKNRTPTPSRTPSRRWLQIRQSQIIAHSGGFSAGDEPKVPANLTPPSSAVPASAMSNGDAEKQGRSDLGICNGFQA